MSGFYVTKDPDGVGDLAVWTADRRAPVRVATYSRAKGLRCGKRSLTIQELREILLEIEAWEGEGLTLHPEPVDCNECDRPTGLVDGDGLCAACHVWRMPF